MCCLVSNGAKRDPLLNTAIDLHLRQAWQYSYYSALRLEYNLFSSRHSWHHLCSSPCLNISAGHRGRKRWADDFQMIALKHFQVCWEEFLSEGIWVMLQAERCQTVHGSYPWIDIFCICMNLDLLFWVTIEMLESNFTPKIKSKSVYPLLPLYLSRHELYSDAYLSLKAAYG